LDDVTRIVVDEIRERDLDTDRLLLVLKQLLANPMATGNAFFIALYSNLRTATLSTWAV